MATLTFAPQGAGAGRDATKVAAAYFALCLLAVAVHAPALSGWFRFDPIYLVSGLTAGTWHSNGLLQGYPWLDPNAGVTTQALGALAAHDWLHGVLPWWNPYNGVGLPLAAEGQTPAFFLPFVLLLGLPHGLLLLRIMLMALAGCFTFALLRRLAVGLTPALAGAALFELNGSFAWFAHGPIMPIAFLPLVLLGLEQARAGGFPVAVAAGTAWSFLAGFPETAVLNMGLAASWGLLRCAQAPRPAAYALRCCLAALAGMLLAAPAIWPFLEALPRAFIGRHVAGHGGTLWQANPAQALFPTLLGNPLAMPQVPAVMGVWWRAGGYLPLPAACLALAGLCGHGRERALRWVLAGFVGVTACRAAGLAPISALFDAVPLLNQAIVHVYVWPAWSMASAVLAAFALQDVALGKQAAWLPVGAATALLALLALRGAAPAMRAAVQAAPALYHPALGVAAGGACAMCVLGLLAATRLRLRVAWAACIVTGHAAALFAFWLLAGPHDRVPDDGSVRFLQNHLGLGRVIGFGPLVPNYGAMFGVAQLGANALPAPATWVAAARQLRPDFDGINFDLGAVPAMDHLPAAMAAYQAWGAAYALTWPGVPLPGATRVHAGTAMDVWTLPDPLPYADAPGCTLRAEGRLSFTLSCQGGSRLLRRELFDPGWSATVNGRSAKLTESGLFQQLPVPPGVSQVRFIYAPPFIGFAWAGCAIGVLLLIGGSLSVAYRRARVCALNR